ncbi:MAG: hypothetical protein E7461_04690 [Ruminococcaceae bacterium]|nr:hypothetical protein [Oscillospiraceae bacterium]
MKRFISILLVISMLFSFGACGEKKYTVTFETNGGSAISSLTVVEGKPVSEPAQPTKDGMFFAGWFRDAELTKAYDFSAPVTENITLYAKWTRYEGSVAADSAPVDTYFISGLTINGESANVVASAPAGCKLLVRFMDEEVYFSDNYPENKVYLAEGSLQASCAVTAGADMETVTAKVSGTLPQYFVAEAVLINASGKELCSPVSDITHTKRFAKFDSTTIHDFAPEDTVLQFTDSETDNFGVISEQVITLQAESFTCDEEGYIYEIFGPSQTVKAGDKVMLTDGENLALLVVASVTKGDPMTIVADADGVSLEDFYQFLKVDQNIVSSAEEDDKVSLSGGATALRGQVRKAKNGTSTSKTVKLKLDRIHFEAAGFRVDGAVTGDISAKLLLQWDMKGLGKNYFRCDFTYTADMDAKLSIEDSENASGQWEDMELSLGKVRIPFGVPGLNAFAEINARIAWQSEGGMELQGGFKTTQGFRYSTKDGYQTVDQKKSRWTMSSEGFGQLEFGPMPVVGVSFFRDAVTCELDSFIGVRAEGVVAEPEHTGDRIHACNRCAEGTLYSVCFTDAVMEYDICKSLSGRPIDENIVYSHEYLCDFFVSLDNEANSMFGGKITFGMGLCPNWIQNTVATEPPTAPPTTPPTAPPTEPPTTPPTAPSATEPPENYSEGLEYTLNSNNKSYEVTGIGSCSDTEIIIPPENEGLPVTGIGDYAFNRCTSLTGITIPNSVTSIGEYAFEYCTSLTGITIPNSVTSIGDDAFRSCTSLTSLTIPNRVTSIGDSAFWGCTSLTGITIPNSVTSIGDYAFSMCTRLTDITIPNSVTSIGWHAFYKCTSLTGITIPNSVTSIYTNAFEGCTSLVRISVDGKNPSYSSDKFGVLFNKSKSRLIAAPGAISGAYSIPSSVTSIGDRAFYDCTSLTVVTIPDSVTSIGSCAFLCCTSLTRITIPNSVTSIGDSAFQGCTSLAGITIPNNVTSIGGSAFQGCTSLTGITIPSSVTSIGTSAFEYCTSLTGITIPSSVTSIGDGAFFNCTSLTSISIPNSVTSISDRAFQGCTSLTGITIPNSVIRIGDGAFEGCTGLTRIIIPNIVVSIGQNAFSGCTRLTDITYTGSVARWEAVGKGSGWNDSTGKYTIYCTDGQIAKDGTVTYK